MHHHRIVPILLLAVAIPIAAFFVFLGIANLLTHDATTPDDASLQLPTVHVADSSNAFVEMAQIEGAHSFSQEPDQKLTDAVNHASWDEVYASALLEQHANDIRLFRKGAAKSVFQDPTAAAPQIIDWNLNAFPSLNSYRQSAEVVALDAERRGLQNDVSGALDEALDVVNMGHLIESGQSFLIEYLVGSSIKQIGLTALRQIAFRATLSAADVKSVSQKLEAYRDSREGEITATKLEYLGSHWGMLYHKDLGTILSLYFLSTSVDGSPTDGEQPGHLWSVLQSSGLTRYYFFPNQTWQYMVDVARNNVSNAEADCTVVSANPKRVLPEQRLNFATLFTRNAIGKIMASLGEVSFGGLSIKRCNESVAVSATQAVFAIRAFTLGAGHPPASLAELLPAYLDVLPIDPYIGEPLHYSAEKQILYSLGPNRKDLGGDTVSDDWQHQTNPTFAVGL